jgi:ketosteroid isomerase-like protein
MELWELVARESIRDLVARYNANGDSGRFEEMMKVFADDAVMELVAADGTVRRYEGAAEVATIFTATKSGWDTGTKDTTSPAARHHVRHFTSTHQIDLLSETQAKGRLYYLVVMAHGVDHWGRYIDDYGVRRGRWVITQRRALSDGRVEHSLTNRESDEWASGHQAAIDGDDAADHEPGLVRGDVGHQ